MILSLPWLKNKPWRGNIWNHFALTYSSNLNISLHLYKHTSSSNIKLKDLQRISKIKKLPPYLKRSCICRINLRALKILIMCCCRCNLFILKGEDIVTWYKTNFYISYKQEKLHQLNLFSAKVFLDEIRLWFITRIDLFCTG